MERAIIRLGGRRIAKKGHPCGWLFERPDGTFELPLSEYDEYPIGLYRSFFLDELRLTRAQLYDLLVEKRAPSALPSRPTRKA